MSFVLDFFSYEVTLRDESLTRAVLRFCCLFLSEVVALRDESLLVRKTEVLLVISQRWGRPARQVFDSFGTEKYYFGHSSATRTPFGTS